MAAQVTLTWDANDPTPDGYYLYQRLSDESYDYDQPIWSGSGTTATVDSLTEGLTYYFVVRAHVGSDESGDSNEVEYTPPVDDQTPVNQTPSADAGSDQTVLSEAQVTLDSTGSSDPDGDTLSYSWVQTSGTAVVLSTITESSFSFSAPTVSTGSEVLVFTLTVTDPSGAQASDQCQITVEAPTPVNQAPVADAGTNQTIATQGVVTLDGSGSYDPEGQLLTYQWHQTSGTTVALSSSDSVRASFSSPDISGATITLAFELTVTDNQGASSADTCLVVIEPSAPADSDGDGVNDDSDAFPANPDEWADNDNDGTGDNADTDDDNDGMPDTWEIQYGLDPFTNDAGLDADGDGMTNLEEYQAGSDPMAGEEENSPPSTPTILSPEEGATVVYYKLKIRSSAFSDPDEGDQHARTQWRIIDVAQQSVVLDTTLSQRGLTSIWVPRMILDPGKTYICKVRYFDDHGQESDWSPEVQFTAQTKSSRFYRSATESTVSMDLNADQIDDSLQTDIIASLETYNSERSMGISIESGSNTIQILGIDAFDPGDLEESAPCDTEELPYGMLGYKIEVSEPGQTATFELLYSELLDSGMQWYRYDSITGWQVIEDIDTNADGNGVVRQITDGSEEDADGVANGIIVELVGPRSVSTQDADTDSGLTGDDATTLDGLGSGCFLQSLIR